MVPASTGVTRPKPAAWRSSPEQRATILRLDREGDDRHHSRHRSRWPTVYRVLEEANVCRSPLGNTSSAPTSRLADSKKCQ